LFSDLEKEIKRCFYEDKQDAADWARRKAEIKGRSHVNCSDGQVQVGDTVSKNNVESMTEL